MADQSDGRGLGRNQDKATNYRNTDAGGPGPHYFAKSIHPAPEIEQRERNGDTGHCCPNATRDRQPKNSSDRPERNRTDQEEERCLCDEQSIVALTHANKDQRTGDQAPQYTQYEYTDYENEHARRISEPLPSCKVQRSPAGIASSRRCG